MTRFTVGKYKTRSGNRAAVVRLKQIGGDWILVGYIVCATKALVISHWRLNGQSISENNLFDLVP